MQAINTQNLGIPVWDAHAHLFTWDSSPPNVWVDRKEWPLGKIMPFLKEMVDHPLWFKYPQKVINLFRSPDIDTYPLAREFSEIWEVGVAGMCREYRAAGVGDVSLLNIDWYGFNKAWPLEQQWAKMIQAKKIAAEHWIRFHLFMGLDPARPGAAFLLSQYHQQIDGVKLYLPISDCTPTQFLSLVDAIHAYGLPVTSHTSRGGVGWKEEKASPSYQAQALERHPDLRWNYAHFGGGSDAWRMQIERLCLEYEWVFTDLSFMTDLFYHSRAFSEWVVSYAETEEEEEIAHRRPAILDRLIWGSDRSVCMAFYTIQRLVPKLKAIPIYYRRLVCYENAASFSRKYK